MIWLGAAAAATVICGAAAVSAQPGDNSDPVVTKSYIDKVVSELKEYVDAGAQKTQDSGVQAPAASGVSSAYQVLDVLEGQKITLGEGTEFILRAGRGVIFATVQGGIADTTDGKDLSSGEMVPLNHLLIVPRADGRGFTAGTDSVVMVRGSYQIQ